MATYNKFNAFVEAVKEGKHNFETAQLRVAFCAAANAPVATNSVLANLTPVSTANLDTTAVVTSSSSQTSGTYKLVVADLTMTATGGAFGPFQFVVVYNDSAPADELICWFDYGSEISLNQNETFTIDFGTELLSYT
jgi:hypothetical protein